jgi:hypothetical protein
MDPDRCRTDAQACEQRMTKLSIVADVAHVPLDGMCGGPSFRVSPRFAEMNNTACCAGQADSTPAVQERPVAERKVMVSHRA